MTARKMTIGIVGGAGPMAGALLVKKIIELCQRQYGCIHDSDFPKIILLSYPFSEMLQPDLLAGNEKQLRIELQESLDFLIEGGANYLGIACNTLHGFVKTEGAERLIKLTDVVENDILESGYAKVLVLCTSTSLEKHVYPFSSAIFPPKNKQVIVDQLIQNVMSGEFSLHHKTVLEQLITSEQDRRGFEIDAVLVGCSELSVLVDQFPLTGIVIIDPLELLANQICKKIFK